MQIDWSKIKLKWMMLEPREQRALMIAALVIGVLIVYLGIWSPINHYAASLRDRSVSQQRVLAEMQVMDKQMQFNGHEQKHQSLTPVALLNVLQKRINQAGLSASLTDLKLAGNNAIEMHFQRVMFDSLIRLLTQVVQEHGVSISQFSVSADTTPGVVNAQLMLRL